MSNADEIIKFKELMDTGVITKEEFEEKKKELLGENKEVNNNLQQENHNYSYTKKKTLNKKLIIILAIIFIPIIAIGIGVSNESLTNQLQTKVNFNVEQSEKAVKILNDCGITYGTIESDSSLDDLEIENSQGFRIKQNDINVILYVKDGEIYSVKYASNYLYKDGQIQSKLSDYVETNTSSSNTTEKFTLVSSNGSTDSYGYTTITGEIKNNTNKTYTYVQVTFSLYDNYGNQVGTALANINNLEANGVWSYKAVGMGSTKGTKFKCTGIDGW